ncbi:MAG: hypothetical protein LAN84_00390 [Acidobacteriia bacterium]|nr:hypothetical protein [Terriglobia bacterium]
MSPGPLHQLWRVGDRVRFAHEHPSGPIRVVTALSDVLDDPMVELEGMCGQFGSHLFIAADYPADSIVPRPAAEKS